MTQNLKGVLPSTKNNDSRIYYDSAICPNGDSSKLARKEKIMKLAVVGSRGFNDFEKLSSELDVLHQNEQVSLVISGGAVGTDLMAERWAKNNLIETQIFLPDWNRWKKSAAIIRNIQIIAACDKCIAFWDGTSRGTKHSIDLAKKAAKPLTIISI